MLFIVLRKILNNKGLIAALLVGSILAVAMISAIPMYTNAILQRMLVKDFESYQENNNEYPGRYVLEANIMSHAAPSKRMQNFEYFNQEINARVLSEIGLPAKESVLSLETKYINLTPRTPREKDPPTRELSIVTFEDFADHIELVQGRMPSGEMVDGVMEVLVQEETLQSYDMYVDEVYEVNVTLRTEAHEPFYVKPVGVYTVSDSNDLWWYKPANQFKSAMLMDWDLYMKEVAGTQNMLCDAVWYYALDYTQMKIDRIEDYTNAIQEQKKWMGSYEGTSATFGALSILEGYGPRESTLRITLWVLQVPIMIMLAFYIFMVSQMVVSNDANEIAVLKSRGAKGGQIFRLYILQSCLLAGVALVIGPFVGYGICSLLGSSNGFLEFIGRKTLPVHIGLQVILYALGAALFTVVMMMFPAMSAARVTIVEHKQKKARQWNAPLWQKMFLDVICLGLAIYGLYSYQLRQATISVGEQAAASSQAATATAAAAAASITAPVDPLLFLISTLFILGAGLLFLRLYPYIIRLIFWLGRRVWSPVLYTSFISVGRSGGRETFVMLFLILTLSVGVFSANSARTINQNIEDRIHYAIGADMVMELKWPSNSVVIESNPSLDRGQSTSSTSTSSNSVVIYKEPPFETVESIKGVEAAAKVFMPEQVRVRTDENQYLPSRLMAIEPDQFGKVVWTGGNYLSHHIYAYLNLISNAPNAVLASSSLQEDGYAVGDPIRFSWGSQSEVEGVIYAFVDYWPAINPTEADSERFVIANLDYVQAITAIEPYQYWIKRDGTTATAEIYQDIADKEIPLLNTQEMTDSFKRLKNNSILKIDSGSCLVDASQQLVIQKNDALLQGTNGALTLGFLVTMAIAMIGFNIYWVLSIRGRELQFGILRAIGMTQKKVIGILVCEQIMISLVAVLVGVLIGSLTSQLYVPLLSIVYSASEQVPPFTVVASRSDYLKIYGVIAFMLATGFAILGTIVSRIKIAQAIKLGED